MSIGRDAAWLLVGCFVALAIQDAFPQGKTFDEKKWERLEAQREMRSAIERKYEACYSQCRESCK
jgi:hypothetical protein